VLLDGGHQLLVALAHRDHVDAVGVAEHRA
jgi:hypothetical protein